MSHHQGNEVRLGRIRGMKQELVMSAEDRQTHLWLPGNSGTGKSKLMESMICRDIDAWGDSGLGLMLIDPHGSVYRNVLIYVAESRLDRPVIPLDFTRGDSVLGYNLLRGRQGGDPSVVVRALVEAIAHVFGQSGTQETTRFARVAGAVLMALLMQRRPFLDAYQLVASKAAMGAMADAVGEEFTRSALIRVASLADKEFLAEVESTMNRLRPFSVNQRFKAIFGHLGETLDLGKVLDEGSILLVNLGQDGSFLSEEDAKLFGTLLLTDLWTAAKARGKPDDEAEIRPSYVYIDEAQNFVTPTIAANLTEARGYGLNLIIANQYPSQFLACGESGKAMHKALMAAARSKIVFQMDEADDVEALARQLFGNWLDPMRVKRWTTKVTGYEQRTTVSRTTGTSSQRGGSEGSQRGAGTGRSQRAPRDADDRAQLMDGGGERVRDRRRGPRPHPRRGGRRVHVPRRAARDIRAGHPGPGQAAVHGKAREHEVPRGPGDAERASGMGDEAEVEAYVAGRFSDLPYAVPLAEAVESATRRERRLMGSVMRDVAADEPSSAKRKVSPPKA